MPKKKPSQSLLPGQVGSDAALAEFEQSVADGKKGRPKGRKNLAVDQADGHLTTCRACGSTKRIPYFNKRELPIAGVHLVTRQPYTKIVIRRTKCVDCGQHRDDRHFENRPQRARKK